jgi:hypothetical protein
MNPIEVNGVTYTSVVSAWRNVSPEGLTMSAVRWRLRQGWPASQALTLATVPPERRRTFKELRDRAA